MSYNSAHAKEVVVLRSSNDSDGYNLSGDKIYTIEDDDVVIKAKSDRSALSVTSGTPVLYIPRGKKLTVFGGSNPTATW